MGLLQGLTEFLPVSSSGHLLFAQHLFGVEEYGLAFDVALHIGTLGALIIYFHRDIVNLAVALFRKGRQTRLAWLVVLATMPAVLAGMLLQDFAESTFRSPYLVSFTLMAVAVLMIVAERINARRTQLAHLQHMNRWQALAVGAAQAVALVPGVSRSGSTITAGLFAGLDRVAATRFSFLLSIPITAGAIAKVLLEDSELQQISQEPGIFLIGILAAFVSGLLAIRFLLKFVARHSLNVFAYYRIGLGVLMLAGLILL